jgi:hypothetical protein
MEEWKTIDNFYNYEISNNGQVRNKTTGKINELKPNKLGYYVKSIYNDDDGKKAMKIYT